MRFFELFMLMRNEICFLYKTKVEIKGIIGRRKEIKKTKRMTCIDRKKTGGNCIEG